MDLALLNIQLISYIFIFNGDILENWSIDKVNNYEKSEKQKEKAYVPFNNNYY